MFKIVLLSSVLVAIGISAVEAAPNKPGVADERTYDRWVALFHPEELVGPPVDPGNPLYKADIVAFDPQPEPPKQVEIVVVQR
ncbi:MAG: hypothetical protein ABIY37_06295 [Devosia sp.]